MMREETALQPPSNADGDGASDDGMDLIELGHLVAKEWKLVLGGSSMVGLVALGIAFVIPPTYTATTTFLPPQQQQSSTAASALAALGPLAALAGASGMRTPADQYVALMQSVSVADRLIDQFKLLQVYDKKFRVDARKELASNVRIAVGKKDGLITVDVEDESPQRAADIANRYVDELRRMTSTIAVSEAQQRRLFFERQLAQTRDKLTAAQMGLQASGFSQGALKAEPRAAAEGYARLRAEVTAAEVRLQAARGSLVDDTPEIRQLQATVTALRAQLGKLEQMTDTSAGPDYVGKYREFKYQETLFEMIARQYEMARVDESREGALIQVVDTALPPEKKTKPKKALIALASWAGALVVLIAFVLLRNSWRQRAQASA